VLEVGKISSFYTQAKGDWLEGDYINLPKIGLVKVRYHRPIPTGFTVKICQVIKKADGWYINLAIEDKAVADFTPDEIKPTEDNSLGIDMGLEKFLTASSGEIVPIYQPLRKNQEKLTAISQKKNKRKKGSRRIRVNPNYTSQICCNCNAHVPKELSERIPICDCGLVLDRDWNASLNIKRVGLDVFPTIKRRKGKDKDIRIIPKTTSTLKEILELTRSSRHTS
jgi:transposase